MRIATTDQKNELFPSSQLFVASSAHTKLYAPIAPATNKTKHKTNSFFTHNKQLK